MLSTRVRRGTMQTPVVEFTRGKQLLTFLAMSHIGSADYYTEVEKAVIRLEPVHVMYEFIAPAAEEDWYWATPEEVHARNVWNDDKAARQAVAEVLGWVVQGEETMPPCSWWERADMTDLEFIRRVGPDQVARMFGSFGELAGRLEEMPPKMSCMVIGLAFRAHHTRTGRVLRRLLPHRGSDISSADSIILGERNRQQLARIPHAGDVALIWGAAHLDGIASGLEELGFSVSSVSWRDVGSLRGIRETSG